MTLNLLKNVFCVGEQGPQGFRGEAGPAGAKGVYHNEHLVCFHKALLHSI